MKVILRTIQGASAAVLSLCLACPGCEPGPAVHPEPPPPAGSPGVSAPEQPTAPTAAGQSTGRQGQEAPSNSSAAEAPAPDQPAPPEATGKDTGKPAEKKAWLENKNGRRTVHVVTWVCLRQGSYGLETLLCRKASKEHESILATDADARLIHALLLAAGARAGSPVQFEPQLKSPTGSEVKVTLQYEAKGKTVTVPAQQWIRNVKTRKDLEHDWVFAGSRLLPNPDGDDKPPLYAANLDGAYICVNNVPTAMLDLPINSPNSLENRVYDINTDRVPELGTKVITILAPVPEGKK